jgi:hypothetical protein
MKIKVYYGISGTLKSTTLDRKYKWPFSTDIQDGHVIPIILRSAIKIWKTNRDQLFPWLSKETNLNYALLHLVRMEEYIQCREFENYLYIIERGISDMMFYEYQKSPEIITPSIINGAINQESKIFGKSESIEKILMIMKDEKFIAEKVLSEKTRANCFRGVQDYLQKQEDYIRFTKKYNQIDKEIVIEDAREYLSNLGIEYNV